MSNIVQRDDTAVATMPEPVSLLQVIERASRDPNVDIDKMERLMAMHERMMAKKDESEFNDAIVQCQHECGTISADATNPQTRSKYATYAKLDKVLRPIYTKHGISISYSTEDSPKPEHIRVIAYVSRKGYTRKYQADMPADGKGAKGGDVMTITHAVGAAMSYGMRYLLKMIFNVAVGEDDRDGNDTARVIPVPPAGFDSWWLDMFVVAKEQGFEALTKAWKASKPEYRQYVQTTNQAELDALKVVAKAVKVKA